MRRSGEEGSAGLFWAVKKAHLVMGLGTYLTPCWAGVLGSKGAEVLSIFFSPAPLLLCSLAHTFTSPVRMA